MLAYDVPCGNARRRLAGGAILVAMVTWLGCGGRQAGSPIVARLTEQEGFATFTHLQHADNRIGYRFHEHTPMIHGQVPQSAEDAGIDPQEVARLKGDYAARPGVICHYIDIDRKEWAPQEWTFYLVPVADGIDLLLVVQAGRDGLNEFYGVQQCFRMSGRTNEAWRHEIAETPAFSEYDLWDAQSRAGSARTSLTFVLRGGRWETLPAKEPSVGARTPLGVRIDDRRTGGQLQSMTAIGPYNAEVLPPVDCGLITRTDTQHEWICGIFWERTSHVTNHHPADCLHNIVNIGGVPPGGSRAVRGKIYWFKGSLDELAGRWRRDFPESR